MKIVILDSKSKLSIHVVWGAILILLLSLLKILPSFACPFYHITGIPCMSCGTTRAVAAIWRGDIIDAFWFNPLVMIFTAGLFFFSLLKFGEFIFHKHIKMNFGPKAVRYARYLLALALMANWLFIVVNNR